MSTIYMIRHGQASFSSECYDNLSDLGREQSVILGEYMGSIGVEYDSVYSGNLQRQIQTAKTAMNRLRMWDSGELRTMSGLNEYDAHAILTSQLPAMLKNEPELDEDTKRMNERRSFQRVFERAMMRWVSGRFDVEGIENWKAFSARVRESISRIMKENGRKKTVAIFTSGGPICAAVQMAIGVTGEVAVKLNWQLWNTSISIFKYNDEEIFLGSFNSVHHLQIRRDPELLTYR